MLTAGYWPVTFWADNFWNDNYWPNYGSGGATAIHMKQISDIDLEDLYEMPLRVSFRPLPDELQFKDK